MDEKDKDDKEKVQEDDMLTTRNDPEDEAPDMEPDAPEQPDEEEKIVDTELLLEQIAHQDQKILKLEEAVKSLKAKKKADDVNTLAGAIKALSGLALSPDGFAAFKQMVPYIFEE
jgi:hypothetical protein